MSAEITYRWAKDYMLIDLGNRIEPRIRVLFWAEFLFTLAFASVFMVQAFPIRAHWIHWCTAFGASLLFILAAIRFISRIYLKEQLILTDSHLTVVQRTFFRREAQRYHWYYIGPLHYLGKDNKTDHPLKGKSFDYFGFETHEHLIQNLHQEGSLCFTYHGHSVRFGKFVYSWHAEEVVRMMKLYMGETLQLGSEWRRIMQEHEWDDAQQ